MPGSIFYQSVGNPVQRSRLPDRPMSVAFATLQSATPDQKKRVRRLLVALWIVSLIPAVPFLNQLASGISLSAVIVAATLLLWKQHEGLASVSLKDCGLALLPLAILAVPLPLAVSPCVLPAALLAWMTHQLATRCSATSSGYSTVMQLSPLAIVVLGWLTGSWLVPLMISVSMLLFQFFMSGAGEGRLATLCSSLVTWLDCYRCGMQAGANDANSPGEWIQRVGLTAATILAVTAFVDSVIPTASLATPGMSNLALAVASIATTASVLLIPPMLVLPVVHEASQQKPLEGQSWQDVVDQVQESRNPIERRSVFMGRLVEDQSPLLVPKEVFREHAHFLGDTGTGKTSLGLLPLVEQLMGRGDCSVVVIDLKGDSRELLSTLQSAAATAEQRTSQPVPVRHFTNQLNQSTFAFNPLSQPHWSKFDLYTKTDILCAAMGLNYGTDYGQGFYSSANAGVLYYTLKTFPALDRFEDLAARVGFIARKADPKELHPEIRRAGVHVHEVLKRLGSFESLNVTNTARYDESVLRDGIDMGDVFQQPQGLYFHLPATIAPGSSPEIARLIVYFLMSAAATVQRRHQVYLVIDEFQRMVAGNIEYILQLARSMDISVILANQGMQDLKTSSSDLIPTIDANCRYRQWFGVSAFEDRQRLIESSGETIRTFRQASRGANAQGNTWSVSQQEQLTPRLTSNHILLASDHPKRSIVRISRGAGYAQFGGMPFIVESDHHISFSEYERRRSLPWPSNSAGTFIPTGRTVKAPRAVPDITSEIQITHEVVGLNEPDPRTDVENPFAAFLEERQRHKETKSRRRKRHDDD